MFQGRLPYETQIKMKLLLENNYVKGKKGAVNDSPVRLR